MENKNFSPSTSPDFSPVLVLKKKDFRGGLLPRKLDAEGKKVVDVDALWNNDPEAYLRWNDSQNGGDTEDSREMLSAVIAKREAEKQALKERKKAETVPSVRQNLQTQIANLDAQISMYGGFLAEYEEEARKAEVARQEEQDTEAEQKTENSEQTEQKSEQNAVEAEQTEQTSAQKSEDEGTEGSEVSEENVTTEQGASAEEEKGEGVEHKDNPAIEYRDPRLMSDGEKESRGEMLRNAQAVDVGENQIAAKEGQSARKAAENWWRENVPEPVLYNTEVGEVEINKTTIKDSLSHRYGQAKLDAITSLVEGFENAVYLGTLPDHTRQAGVNNHYFAFPINYKGERCYVFCRAMQDANKNRLYVHEVFVASNIKKGNTLQTAAFQPHGGIALYRDILANVLDISSACEGKQTSEKNKTSFADEMLADTLSNAPEELKGRITVRESSTGDEQEENIVQTYDIDGKPSGISRIELFDAKSNEDSTRFVIDGSDVDAASSEQDKWESLAREYHKTHPDVKLYIGDESGIGFSTFKDAYEFRNWTETRQQETSGTSEAKQEAKSENEKSHKAEGCTSAVSQVSNKALGIKDPAQQLAFEAVSQMLSDAGIPVEQVSNETMRQMAEGAEKKGEMLDTVLPEDESSFKGTVMSSTSGTKVLNNLDNAITRYEENPNNKPTNFLGDAAAALGATKHGSNSQYATFETKNGEVVTIRLSNHNAKVSNFDNHEEDKGISIVISRKPNARITNDGKSSVTEFFYSDKQLSKLEGKPLADILKSIKQALYSGEYKDTTGLAQVEEVNAENIPEFMTVYHGSGAKFDNRKFPTYIDQVPLFNVVFPRSAYRILGYGRIDGKFVKYLEQPYIDFGTATPLTVDERVQYMHDLGFEPINEEKTVLSDGEIVVSDLQKSNIVRDAAGNVRVIDADVKLHTKDIGGSYTYPPVEADTNINDDPQYQHIRY